MIWDSFRRMGSLPPSFQPILPPGRHSHPFTKTRVPIIRCPYPRKRPPPPINSSIPWPVRKCCPYRHIPRTTHFPKRVPQDDKSNDAVCRSDRISRLRRPPRPLPRRKSRPVDRLLMLLLLRRSSRCFQFITNQHKQHCKHKHHCKHTPFNTYHRPCPRRPIRIFNSIRCWNINKRRFNGINRLLMVSSINYRPCRVMLRRQR